jgi:capsule synthesis protein PGA_cap
MPAMERVPRDRLPWLVLAGLLAVGIAVPMTGSELGLGGFAGSEASAAPSVVAVASPPGPAASETLPPVLPSPSSVPSPTPSTAPSTGPVQALIVPVTQFRATVTSTSRAEVQAVLAGTSRRSAALTLVDDEADAILAAIGATRPSDATRLVLARDAATLTRDLARNRDRLAFLRADDVSSAVRALAWGRVALFGVDRVKRSSDWPLQAVLPGRAGATGAPGATAFDPGATWTLFAGGDILLDRGVYQTVAIKGRGVDFPFDGGTAEITGHTCCSSFGWEVPQTRRTGGKGAMRTLIRRADIAVANFENPAPDQPRYHTSGTRFTADPRLIDGLVKAGIDYVSIANNHIGDAGDAGILQTIANLRKRGLKYSGAGKDLAAARKPALLTTHGVTVAILGYNTIAPTSYFAGTDETGSSQLSLKRARADIKGARKAGADIVIVFPHWGTEYKAKPFAAQQQLARAIIDAGADMIIGNHAHWAAAMEIYHGKPIWYALGNFVFDQTWSEPTMEGITLEMTFEGSALRQVRIRPHIILDKAQPNFLDPAGDGKVVLGQVFDASKGLLPY